MLSQIRILTTLGIFIFGSIVLFGQPNVNINKVSTNLETDMLNQPNDFHEISILLSDRVNAHALHLDYRKQKTPLRDRAREVITLLQAKAAQTQTPILNMLNQSADVEQGSIYPYWITNVIFVTAKPELIAALSQRSDIEWIDKSYSAELDSYTSAPLPEASMHSPNGHESGHDAINATGMWSLGYTGRGRTAMIFDTGTDPTHPALQANYRGNYFPASWGWFSFGNPGSTTPFDCDDHGTHVTGTTVGVDRVTNDTIGVAPNAYWMSTNGICSGANQNKMTAVFQWGLDPDSNPNTIEDMPDAINNSWWHPGMGDDCNSFYVSLFNALEAAGIAVVYSAGNDGPGTSSITPPKNINTDTVNVFCVANVNGNFGSFPIAGSSSRGPSLCGGTGTLLIKPEVSAPGTSVRSSIPGGAYDQKTGTSMSAPHVTGAILLLKEAFPYLSGTDIKLALFHSATDLGAPGEDNFYGNGIINVVAAYNYLVSKGNTPAPTKFANDAGLITVFQQNENICDSVFFPVMTIRNNGSTDISSLKIGYTLANGDTGSFSWSGLIPVDQSLNIVFAPTQFNPGSYELDYEILLVNGAVDSFQIDNFGSGSINLLGRPIPSAPDPQDICVGGSAYFQAISPDTNVTLRWYDSPTGANYVAEGETYLTPALGITQNYYLGGVYKTRLGMYDNSSIGGINLPQTGEGLIFDCSIPVRIKSVKVYADVAGNRQIVVRNSNQNIVGNWVGPIGAGEQVIPVNFSIQPGQNYEISLGAAGNGGLYTSFSGFSYPMTFNEFITITGSTNALYNHFYDWEVEIDLPCPRVTATANVSVGNAIADFSVNSTTDTIDISNGSSVYFSNLSAGATSYQWDFGDSTSSTDANPVHQFYSAGTYTVVLWASGSDNCSDAITKEITITGEWPYVTNIENDFSKFGTVKVFPNPNSGRFQIELNLRESTAMEFNLYDPAGRKVWTKHKDQYLKNVVSVNLSDLPDGVYYLSF
ncbi:MAG: S8 family serine peptidase, partial [Bacteroidetes bacterium]|nr:S8 family serine peptidase [Bacteroidota bacterium]